MAKEPGAVAAQDEVLLPVKGWASAQVPAGRLEPAMGA